MKTHISNIRNYIGDREQINNIQIISACVLTPSLSNVKKIKNKKKNKCCIEAFEGETGDM